MGWSTACSVSGSVFGVELVWRFLRASLNEWDRLGIADPTAMAVVGAPPSFQLLQPIVDLVEGRAPGDADSTKVMAPARDV